MSASPLHLRFTASEYQKLHRMSFMAPTLIWVRHGIKQMQTHGLPLRCPAGECLCLPACESYEMENLPDTQGLYQAEIFVAPRAWLERFLQQYRHRLPTDWNASPHFACPADLADELNELIHLQAADSPLADLRLEHAWQGVLLRLAEQGLGAPLFNLQPLTLTQRIQTLLQFDLARPWQVQDLTERLGISESTLRRGLRQENTGFSELVSELRLHAAFTRVMTGSDPLLGIALDCGFQSASRFSQNFRQRFGMSPSALRRTRGLADEAELMADDPAEPLV